MKFRNIFVVGSALVLMSGTTMAAQPVTVQDPTTGVSQTVTVSGALTQTSNLPTTVDTNTGASTSSTLRTVPATGSTMAVTQSSPVSLQAQVYGQETTAASPGPVAVAVGPAGGILGSDAPPDASRVTCTGATYNAATGAVSWTANNQNCIIDTAGYQSLGFTPSGTFSATVSVSNSESNSATFQLLYCDYSGNSGASPPVTSFTNATTSYQCSYAHARYIELATTAYASGTAIAYLQLHEAVAPTKVVNIGGGVVGAAASGTALSGNPVRIGISDGTNVQNVLNAVKAATDGTGVGSVSTEEMGRAYTHISTATTTTIKSGKGNLHEMCINTTAALATITAYDSTTGSGTVIGVITNPTTLLQMGPLCAWHDIAFTTGLTIVTTGTQDITVSTR